MRFTLNNIMVTVTLSLALIACEQKGKELTPTSPAPTAAVEKQEPAAMHAPAGAKPGSHEDWCGGHQVPESLCTRCNPSLIPAFKATGDWCAPHGLPESQCLICNPGLKIERPPKTAEARP